MAILLNPNDSAIVQGIKTVGIGKKGSQDLPLDMAQAIKAGLLANDFASSAIGAFAAGLYNKGLTAIEADVMDSYAPGSSQDVGVFIDKIGIDAPIWVKGICLRLAQGEFLSKQEAYQLGEFLFADVPGDGLRGFIASFLRVRYETDDEYEGLLNALEQTIKSSFKAKFSKARPLVQIAEPFDGTDHSWMITPLIGHFLRTQGYDVLHLTGRNSGPKWVVNLWDIMQQLDVKAIDQSQDLEKASSPFGFVANTNQMSDAIERWHQLRKQTIKRPFMSTLERFLNPFGADILIASAFHPPYGVKMLTIAKRHGFKKIVIIRNGIEGTVAFPLLRPVKILTAMQEPDGSYIDKEIVLEVGQFLKSVITSEEHVTALSATHNAALIQQYYKQGNTSDQAFDDRVRFTCEGIKYVLG